MNRHSSFCAQLFLWGSKQQITRAILEKKFNRYRKHQLCWRLPFGLALLGVNTAMKEARWVSVIEFHKHYGASPLVVADLWFQICHLEGELCFSLQQKNEKSLKSWLLESSWRQIRSLSLLPVHKSREELSLPPGSHGWPRTSQFQIKARLRQEIFFRRLKHFDALSNTFSHKFRRHAIVFEAVLVIVQTQMDNGSPIYCV